MDTVSYLLTKYQTWTIPVEGLREITHMKSVKCVINSISTGRFPIPTYKLAGKRVADVRVVAAYLDRQSKESERQHRREQERLRSVG